MVLVIFEAPTVQVLGCRSFVQDPFSTSMSCKDPLWVRTSSEQGLKALRL